MIGKKYTAIIPPKVSNNNLNKKKNTKILR